MTMPAFAKGLSGRLPSESERESANQLRQLIAAHAAGSVKLRVLDDTTKEPIDVILAPTLSDLLTRLLRYVGQGDAVTLVPISQMLTTQQAADILNVSRPYLISLIEKGLIEHTMVGRHRRIKAEHLFDYRDARAEKRRTALAEIAASDAEYL